MNYVIKLPPRYKREEIIEAWVNDVLHDHSYERFRKTIDRLISSGWNRDGVMFMYLHQSTHDIARERIVRTSKFELAEIAFIHPISLN